MYIYCITNKINGKQYIGKCVRPIEKSKNYFGSGIHIKASIIKYGKNNFIKEVLEELSNNDKSLLCEKEIFWIKEKGTKTPNGYNLTDGGDGAKGMTDETKEKIRIKNKLKTGELNSRFGMKNSDEHNKKISQANTGKKHSEETKEKLRMINLGKKLSKETIEKCIQSRTGRKVKKETIDKIKLSQPNSIPVLQFSKNNEFINEYVSASEAMRQTGIFNSSILNCCKGNCKSAGKFIWKYKEVRTTL